MYFVCKWPFDSRNLKVILCVTRKLFLAVECAAVSTRTCTAAFTVPFTVVCRIRCLVAWKLYCFEWQPHTTAPFSTRRPGWSPGNWYLAQNWAFACPTSLMCLVHLRLWSIPCHRAQGESSNWGGSASFSWTWGSWRWAIRCVDHSCACGGGMVPATPTVSGDCVVYVCVCVRVRTCICVCVYVQAHSMREVRSSWIEKEMHHC